MERSRSIHSFLAERLDLATVLAENGELQRTAAFVRPASIKIGAMAFRRQWRILGAFIRSLRGRLKLRQVASSFRTGWTTY